KTNWGPHSYYVALVVEGGVVGTALFAVFLWYVFRKLGAARRVGKALAAARDPLAARVRPLAWGMTAALLGTMAANIFYLTMSFLHFGIAYGAGVMGNLRREPWRTALVPAMLTNFRRAARGHARDADLLHAHWLPTGLVAASLGKPFVLTVHGTDAELARRAPLLARWVLRKARLVICVSNALADAVRGLGVEHVRV